jgi:CubicO group peptidase (beta-lactamase class C family)
VYALIGWHVTRAWLILGLGCVLMAMGDGLFAVQDARSGTVDASYDFTWPVGALLIALAVRLAVDVPVPRSGDVGWRAIVLPLAAQGLAAAIQVYGGFHEPGDAERLVTMFVLIVAMVQIVVSRPRAPAPDAGPGDAPSRPPTFAAGSIPSRAMTAVPLESWQVGPWNRWAYQHVGEVVPTVAVSRGSGPAWELAARPAGLGDEASGLLRTGYVDGLAVLHDGTMALERYGNGMGPDTLHLSQSVGKSVLGLLVGVLVGEGALDPDAPVTEHVPEVAGSGFAGATVRHLLDMTAAIDFVEDYATDFWRYDVACGWHPPVPGADAASILAFLPTIGPAAWRHGERFHYATPNTDLLGLVAERAGGAPLAELIGRALWAPMGAERDAELTVDPAGTAAIGGGFCATLRDYTRLGALVLADGRGIVPADWTARLGAGDDGAFARRTVLDVAPGTSGYGSQWWRRDGRTVARGIHGQLVAVDREADAVVTILSSWPAALDVALDAAQRALVGAVCDRLAGRG